ncbi:MAG: crossover junction endodeoxyribonuclease RuvC, partial [bacterium]
KFEVIFDEHRPDACALETLFFAKNPKAVFQVGQVRGVLILCASFYDVPVSEYSPLEVKQAVVGYGRAAKSQIQYMTRALLGLRETPRPVDAADALAVAICHANSMKMRKLMRKH